jgi:hypothetical protein
MLLRTQVTPEFASPNETNLTAEIRFEFESLEM